MLQIFFIFICNSIGYRPTSPYTITFGVLVLTLKSLYKIANEFYQYVLVFQPPNFSRINICPLIVLLKYTFCYCIVDYKTCTKEYICSSNCVENSMARHINGNGCHKNCESYGRIHVYNGRPQGCTNRSTMG